MIETLIARTFETRNAAHVAHFRTKSYAQHVALGEFYTALIEAVDTLVECHMGENRLIDALPKISAPTGDIAEHLETEMDWIEANRDEIAGDSSSLGNLVDNITALYQRTVYKLRNLK